MLQNLSIRAKLAVLLVVPLILLLLTVAATTAQSAVTTGERRHLAEFSSSTATINTFFTALQSERKNSVQYLAAPTEPGRAEVTKNRAATDAAATGLREAINASGVDLTSSAARDVLAAYDKSLEETLPRTRSAVDQGSSPIGVLSSYSDITATASDLLVILPESASDRSMASQISGFGYLLKRVDALSVEETAGVLVIQGRSTPQLEALRQDAAQRSSYFDQQARNRLSRSSVQLLDAQLRTGATSAALRTIEQDRALFQTGSASSLGQRAWEATLTTINASYQRAVADIGDDVTTKAEQSATASTWRTTALLAGTLLVFAGVTLLGVRVARSIGRRLRDLATAATEVRDELPRMVERMQTPGEGPGVEFTPLSIVSHDEIGDVTKVINDLNETTFRIAGEQAALRASIAEMFVNVARRDQTLLARQLAFLDQLERTEENPDTLEDLFTLDHLATRMRRNAESLLVLAGINTGRRLRRPLPLSDVVRTAAGEIEHYDRVDLALQVDPPVVGHLALSASHMIAELLENATNFSDPGTRVVVGTAETDRGIEVSIKDTGLGMNADEVETAHQRISGGRASEFAGAQRLGFYVVGRLAGRLDVEVEFETSKGHGTTVTLVLPAALFTPGSVKGAEPELAARQPRLAAPSSTMTARTPTATEGTDLVEVLSPTPSPNPAAPTRAATAGATPALPTRKRTARAQARIDATTDARSSQGPDGLGLLGTTMAGGEEPTPWTPPSTPAPVSPPTTAALPRRGPTTAATSAVPSSAPVTPTAPPIHVAPPVQAAPPVQVAPTAAHQSVGEVMRRRNALAATALNALTEGQNFTPSRGAGSAPLVRRQAGATAAAVETAAAALAKPAPARSTAANRQRRAPADVRSMLSGFQAGVSRGRAGQNQAEAVHQDSLDA